MSKNRLEAFSDGVLAIIITIMVLELKAPPAGDFQALKPLFPALGSYLLSFIFIGIYWNNHHHLLQTVECVNGVILWANLHLLFWISLIPFATAWTGASGFGAHAVAFYGVVLLFAGAAYFILTQALVRYHGADSKLAMAVGKDVKGGVSVLTYAIAIPIALWNPLIGYALYILVALIWLIPDSRMERVNRCE